MFFLRGLRITPLSIRPQTNSSTLCYAIVLPGRKSGFRAGSGKHRNRPSGRPSAGRTADFEAFPIRNRATSSPEARCPARKHNIGWDPSFPSVIFLSGPELNVAPLSIRPETNSSTLCYAIALPGWKSGFRAGFLQESCRESINIGPPAGLRPAGVPILRPIIIRATSGPEARFPARKHYCVT